MATEVDGLLHLLAATAQVSPESSAAAASAAAAPPAAAAAVMVVVGETHRCNDAENKYFPPLSPSTFPGGFNAFPAFSATSQHLQANYAAAALALAEEQNRIWQQ